MQLGVQLLDLTPLAPFRIKIIRSRCTLRPQVPALVETSDLEGLPTGLLEIAIDPSKITGRKIGGIAISGRTPTRGGARASSRTCATAAASSTTSSTSRRSAFESRCGPRSCTRGRLPPDMRADKVHKEYLAKARALDRKWCSTPLGQGLVGPAERRLVSFGRVAGIVLGYYLEPETTARCRRTRASSLPLPRRSPARRGPRRGSRPARASTPPPR